MSTGKHFLTVSSELPCGHTLVKCCTVPEPREDWVRDCAEMLAWWVNTRTKAHNCALVTPENPAGFPRTGPGTGFGELI